MNKWTGKGLYPTLLVLQPSQEWLSSQPMGITGMNIWTTGKQKNPVDLGFEPTLSVNWERLQKHRTKM